MSFNFIDKNNRVINILFEDPNINAFYNGELVGEIIFDRIEIDRGYGDYTKIKSRLYYMSVEPNFKRSGIASKMMELAVESYGLYFLRPNLNDVGGSNKKCYEYYTQDGKGFIEECIRRGILKEDLEDSRDE